MVFLYQALVAGAVFCGILGVGMAWGRFCLRVIADHSEILAVLVFLWGVVMAIAAAIGFLPLIFGGW